jgi:uncharacterized protein (DUF2249 family)
MTFDAVQPTSNQLVIERIRAHHTELATRLHELTGTVLTAAKHNTNGEWIAQRDALHGWYRDELLPHIVAEEQTLYSAASEMDTTRLLVCGMLTEHRTLVNVIAELALARDTFETAMIAAVAQALLTGHLGKENDLLLPALDTAGVDLGALLDGMHELLGAATPAAASTCGCGCEPDASEGSAALSDELDVRALPHGQRHEIIFARLDALAPGRALVIVNDHDPKPLRYQTEALWPGRFSWTYREAGPQIWRLAITRAE